MGFTEDETVVRVDFFKESGKWYVTEAVKWTGEWESKKQLLQDSFTQSLRDHFQNNPQRLSEMDAICIHPYFEYSFPICIRNGGWIWIKKRN